MTTNTQLPSYSDGLNELQANLATMLPAYAFEVFDQDANALQAKYATGVKLTKGDKAPDFSLTNAVGHPVSLTGLLKNGKVVLTFYRGSWCPYCNLQLNQYQQALSEIQAKGAQLVAISPQTPDESLNMQEKNALQFEVLSDNGSQVTRQFTTVFTLGETPLQVFNDLGIDFDAHYSDDSREIPVPAVFVIEQDRTISFARSMGGDYRNRVEVAEVIAAL